MDADTALGPVARRSGPRMPAPRRWPALPYEQWRATLDTLHAHTQVLGKLSAALAPPEPQLQHAALRLTARGLGDAATARTRRVRDPGRRPGPPRARGGRGAQRRTPAPDRPRAFPLGGRGDARGPRRGPRCGGTGDDRSPSAGDAVVDSSGRGRGARHVRPGPCRLVFRDGGSRLPGPRRGPCSLPGPLYAGQRLVGVVRPGREPLLGTARGPAVRGLHHAECDGRAGGRRRVVARGRALPTGRLLRLRAPGTPGLPGRPARAASGTLGTSTRRVRPRLGGRPQHRGSAPGGGLLRPRGHPPLLLRVQLGAGPRRERRRRSAPRHLTPREGARARVRTIGTVTTGSAI